MNLGDGSGSHQVDGFIINTFVLVDANGNTLRVQPDHFQQLTLTVNGVVTVDFSNGRVEDKTTEVEAKNGIKIRIFMAAYELIVTDKYNLRVMAEKYHKKFYKRPLLCVLGIIIWNLIWASIILNK